MASIAHSISLILPPSIKRRLLPKWHFLQVIKKLLVTQSGGLRYDKEVSCWVVKKKIHDVEIDIPVRSYREFKRVVNYGENAKDIVFIWLNAIDDCKALYNIGAANGHEGFIANALHNCTVAFVEIFTPSIETILKGVVLSSRKKNNVAKFEVFAAGIDRKPGYTKVHLHNPPVAGGTNNSFDDVDAYTAGGRADDRIWASQWSPAVSIDSLHLDYGIPLPTHVLMDVDGFEDRAMEGAVETLKSGHVRSWMIEINPGREEVVGRTMTDAGYIEISRFVHYPGILETADHLFVRKDLADDYRNRMEQTRRKLFD
jgi:hypothetical protein